MAQGLFASTIISAAGNALRGPAGAFMTATDELKYYG